MATLHAVSLGAPVRAPAQARRAARCGAVASPRRIAASLSGVAAGAPLPPPAGPLRTLRATPLRAAARRVASQRRFAPRAAADDADYSMPAVRSPVSPPRASRRRLLAPRAEPGSRRPSAQPSPQRLPTQAVASAASTLEPAFLRPPAALCAALHALCAARTAQQGASRLPRASPRRQLLSCVRSYVFAFQP